MKTEYPNLEVVNFKIKGLKLISPKVLQDERGYFLESFRQNLYQELGLPEFMQDNHAFSSKNTLRGMHFQEGEGQAKLVTVAAGEIFDVAVDIRAGSATFGQWQSVVLNGQTCQQFFIPAGFAHGYLVISETAHVLYKVSSYYYAKKETGFSWNDPVVNISWSVTTPQLSLRDQSSRSFQELLC